MEDIDWSLDQEGAEHQILMLKLKIWFFGTLAWMIFILLLGHLPKTSPLYLEGDSLILVPIGSFICLGLAWLLGTDIWMEQDAKKIWTDPDPILLKIRNRYNKYKRLPDKKGAFIDYWSLRAEALEQVQQTGEQVKMPNESALDRFMLGSLNWKQVIFAVVLIAVLLACFLLAMIFFVK